MEKIRLGIIGCGNIGKVHTDNIVGGKCPEVELAAVCDLKKERLDEILEKAPGVSVFYDAEEMMDSGLIDSVLVAVPHYDHPKYAIMALK